MTDEIKEILREKGVLDYETMIVLRERAKSLMSELSGLQSKLTDISVDTEAEGEDLLGAIKALSSIEKKLRAEIEVFRQKNWIEEKKRN